MLRSFINQCLGDGRWSRFILFEQSSQRRVKQKVRGEGSETKQNRSSLEGGAKRGREGR